MSLPTDPLFHQIRDLIEQARQRAAVSVNAELVWLYWQIGHTLHTHLLQQERATYGEEVIARLAHTLTQQYGSGYSAQNLRHFIRFAETFPDPEIVSALRRELSWTHFKTLIYLDDALKRDFYLEMCRVERWSTRQLQQHIGTMRFERTALSGPRRVASTPPAGYHGCTRPYLARRTSLLTGSTASPLRLDFLTAKDARKTQRSCTKTKSPARSSARPWRYIGCWGRACSNRPMR